MASKDSYNLTSLLPSSPYLLAYALPLLLLSIVLTFSGTFLTLDRTRSFSPHYDAVPGAYDRPKKKFRFFPEGGVGGLIIGYAFGLHLSTFFALLVPSISNSGTLSSKSFIAIWLLSSIITTGLAGRWKYCALAFAGISGGSLFSLALSVMIHPSLLTRVIFAAVLLPILTILTLLPLIRFQHAALRFATASTGAFGIIVSIALLAHIPGWANVFERLWKHDGADWGSAEEQGMSAGYALFLFCGILGDWLLRRSIGDCPDEKWDSYLANYAANLPNYADRAGTYQPFASMWDRVFGTSKVASDKDILFPPADDQDLDIKLRPLSPPGSQHHNADSNGPISAFRQPPGFLKKGRSKQGFSAVVKERGKRGREAVKFKPLGERELLSSDESDSEGEGVPKRPWLTRRQSEASSTTPTLVNDVDKDKVQLRVKEKDVVKAIDYEQEIKKLGQLKSARITAGLGDGEIPEYSDGEEDLGARRHLHTPPQKDRDKDKEWSPGFLNRHRQAHAPSSTASQRTAVEPPAGAVPVTPSLIKALDRIAVAQKDAFGQKQHSGEGLPKIHEEDRAVRWDNFWKEVRDKAGRTS